MVSYSKDLLALEILW